MSSEYLIFNLSFGPDKLDSYLKTTNLKDVLHKISWENPACRVIFKKSVSKKEIASALPRELGRNAVILPKNLNKRIQASLDDCWVEQINACKIKLDDLQKDISDTGFIIVKFKDDVIVLEGQSHEGLEMALRNIKTTVIEALTERPNSNSAGQNINGEATDRPTQQNDTSKSSNSSVDKSKRTERLTDDRTTHSQSESVHNSAFSNGNAQFDDLTPVVTILCDRGPLQLQYIVWKYICKFYPDIVLGSRATSDTKRNGQVVSLLSQIQDQFHSWFKTNHLDEVLVKAVVAPSGSERKSFDEKFRDLSRKNQMVFIEQDGDNYIICGMPSALDECRRSIEQFGGHVVNNEVQGQDVDKGAAGRRGSDSQSAHDNDIMIIVRCDPGPVELEYSHWKYICKVYSHYKFHQWAKSNSPNDNKVFVYPPDDDKSCFKSWYKSRCLDNLKTKKFMPGADFDVKLFDQIINGWSDKDVVIERLHDGTYEFCGMQSKLGDYMSRIERVKTATGDNSSHVADLNDPDQQFQSSNHAALCGDFRSLPSNGTNGDDYASVHLQRSGKDMQRSTPRQQSSDNSVSSTGGPLHRFTTFRTGIAVELFKGDLIKQKTEAIVNPANSYLMHSGGAAKVIADAAGYQLDRECSDFIRREGELKVGDVMHTTSGRLGKACIQYVIHASGPDSVKICDLKKCEVLVEATFLNCLQHANSVLKIYSISIPAISAGVFGVPIEAVSRAAYAAIMKFDVQMSEELPKKRFLKLINLVNIDLSIVQSMQDMFGKLHHAQQPAKSQTGEDADDGRTKLTSYGDTSNSAAAAAAIPIIRSTSNLGTVTSIPDKCCVCSRRIFAKVQKDCKHSCCNGCKTLSCVKCKTQVRCPAPKMAASNGNDNSDEDSVTVMDRNVRPGQNRNIEQDVTGRRDTVSVANSGSSVVKLETSGGSGDTCVICQDDLCYPMKLKCGHVFCRDCIEAAFKHQKKCPTCGCLFGIQKGNQPNGTMRIETRLYDDIPGYDRQGCIQITYEIPDGIQTSDHPHPGRQYHGTSRKAYLPNTLEGKEIAELLREAFDAKLIFTVGKSTTTGQDDCVTWNDIHHKTSYSGSFGYPDPTYLARVKDELAAKGITLSNADNFGTGNSTISPYVSDTKEAWKGHSSLPSSYTYTTYSQPSTTLFSSQTTVTATARPLPQGPTTTSSARDYKRLASAGGDPKYWKSGYSAVGSSSRQLSTSAAGHDVHTGAYNIHTATSTRNSSGVALSSGRGVGMGSGSTSGVTSSRLSNNTRDDSFLSSRGRAPDKKSVTVQRSGSTSRLPPSKQQYY